MSLSEWLVSLEAFFEGNDDPESIGYNLPDPPEPQEFYRLLRSIRARPDVADVRLYVENADAEDAERRTDTIWVVTSASVVEVAGWFPERLAPDDWVTPDEMGSGAGSVTVPDGMNVWCAFYD
ncbi:hypothetical protein [Haloechinothrix halophila]|uniref:hypothetical protein n=1 Tax=Haloechinothrix halophila TaxID=1069073 RepID=UPI000688CAA8|nr:hypothetical protein [Haloechinothrix halophila]